MREIWSGYSSTLKRKETEKGHASHFALNQGQLSLTSHQPFTHSFSHSASKPELTEGSLKSERDSIYIHILLYQYREREAGKNTERGRKVDRTRVRKRYRGFTRLFQTLLSNPSRANLLDFPFGIFGLNPLLDRIRLVSVLRVILSDLVSFLPLLIVTL